ncbi:hypothetical protein CSUI_010925, partial [Cystoisospora suis]
MRSMTRDTLHSKSEGSGDEKIKRRGHSDSLCTRLIDGDKKNNHGSLYHANSGMNFHCTSASCSCPSPSSSSQERREKEEE